MIQRVFQELLTGATGSYHGRQQMLLGGMACSYIERNGYQELQPLASPVILWHPQNLVPSIAISK